jgi:hypothetical protein
MTVAELQKILTALDKKRIALEGTLKVLGNDLQAEKNKAKPNDATIKNINEKIKATNANLNKIKSDIKVNTGYKTSLSKITTVDAKLKNLYSQYNTLTARGENSADVEKQIQAALDERKTAIGSMSYAAPSYVPKSPIPDNWKKAVTKTETKNKYTGSGSKQSPLLLDGKPFTGTYQGKTYKNGIVVTAATQDGKGDSDAGEKYAGTGTQDNPLTLGGKRFSGTYNGQKYENGILLPEKTGEGDVVYQGLGTADEPLFANGKPFTGTYKGKTYKDGVLVETPAETPKGKKTLTEILKKTEFWYDLPDYIFNLDSELGDLLVEAVNNNWEPEKFASALKLTKWVQKNSENLRKRIIARAKHNELRAAGEDVSKTEYAQDTASLRRSVQDRARRMGSVLTDEQLDQVVGKIYDGFLDNDSVAIDRFIAPYIGKITSIVGTGLGTGGGQATYTGEALTNYQELQRIAKANGLKLEDILPKLSVPKDSTLENVVLQKLALGELDPNAIAQTARQFAAQGQPDYVRKLLNQGYDLEQVYAPYRSIMASTLEIDPNQVDLNDPTLRGAITNEGDMNIYDFKKLLRKDSRWDMTENARQEVSSTVYGILRDFGFQG